MKFNLIAALLLLAVLAVVALINFSSTQPVQTRSLNSSASANSIYNLKP